MLKAAQAISPTVRYQGCAWMPLMVMRALGSATRILHSRSRTLCSDRHLRRELVLDLHSHYLRRTIRCWGNELVLQ